MIGELFCKDKMYEEDSIFMLCSGLRKYLDSYHENFYAYIVCVMRNILEFFMRNILEFFMRNNLRLALQRDCHTRSTHIIYS